MNQFISTNNLENIFAFLDNVYICGSDQEDHYVGISLRKVLENTNLHSVKKNQFFLLVNCKYLGP